MLCSISPGQSVEADGCLQPSLGPLGFRTGTVIGTTELMSHVRRLLRATGAPQHLLESKTSHSLKATCLSWAAKAGLPVSTRRILGGHAQPGDVSVLEYSRDAMSAPLKALDGVLEQIRNGHFDPDKTRSGRWTEVPPVREETPSEAPTEGKELACDCGAQACSVSAFGYKGSSIFKCELCHRRWPEFTAWTPEEQRLWALHFPSVEREAEASDADSERDPEPKEAGSFPREEDPRSAVSSSDEAALTTDVEPATGDEAAVTLQAVALLSGEVSDRSDTTDDDEAWVNPMYWDFGLVRHTSWYTIHAVASPGLLLCGRSMCAAFESVVNPPDSHPVCKVCRARVRGRVENYGQRERNETNSEQDPDTDDAGDRENGESDSSGTSAR